MLEGCRCDKKKIESARKQKCGIEQNPAIDGSLLLALYFFQE